MATDYAECPAYKSKTYYGVVIHNKKYNGWACIFAGDGAMKFRHDNGGKLDFYHGRHEGLDGGPWDNWMSRCWADFLAMAERHNVLADRPAAPFAAGPATEGSEVERRVGPRETGE